MLTVGEIAEAKAKKGLGGWVRARVVAIGAGTITVQVGRRTLELPVRQVRRRRATDPDRAPASLRGAGAAREPAVAPARKPPTVRPSSEARARAADRFGPWRSPEYLAYVRELACCICGAPPSSEASHHGRRGIGQKTDDYRCIPLCHDDHERFHRTGRLGQRSLSETRAFVEGMALHLIGGFLHRYQLVPRPR